jgi:Cys-rich protein (TIGR01571 family)
MSGFQTGLLGCMEHTGSCIDTFCCYCCQIGRQFNAADGMPNSLNVLRCLCSLYAPNLCTALLRCKVVEKFNINEGKIISCCIGCICYPCSICQTHRELALNNLNPGGMCVSQEFARGMQ